MAVSKVGNLVRTTVEPTGFDKWSLLEWFLVIAEPTVDTCRLKRSDGTQTTVSNAILGKEYDFKTFELGSAEELAEHLVLLNLKMDIQTAVHTYQNQNSYYAGYPPGIGGIGLGSGGIPGGTSSHYTTTWSAGYSIMPTYGTGTAGTGGSISTTSIPPPLSYKSTETYTGTEQAATAQESFLQQLKHAVGLKDKT